MNGFKSVLDLFLAEMLLSFGQSDGLRSEGCLVVLQVWKKTTCLLFYLLILVELR